MAKNKELRKDKSDKGKYDNNSPKYKTIEEAYGKVRISDDLKISTTIPIENRQTIKYCFLPNDRVQKSQNKGFNWSQIESQNIYANLGSRTIQQKCVELINSAKEFICLSSFLFENNTDLCKALYTASGGGVRIYLLLASQLMLDRLKEDIEDNETVKSHIEFLNEAGQGYMFIRSGAVHSKFILIDPKSDRSKGILLTANLTKRALELNNEIGINLTSDQVRELYGQFLYGFYSEDTTEYRFNKYSKNARLEPMKPIPINLEKGNEIIWTTNQFKSIAENIEILLKSKTIGEELLISCWNFVLDNEISKNLLQKININSKILLPRISKNYEAIAQLLEKGAKIRCNPLQHAKFIVTKDIALMFSANIESQGLNKGFESGIILKDKKEIDSLRKIFYFWYDNAEEFIEFNKPLSYFENKRLRLLTDDIIRKVKESKIDKNALHLPEIVVQKEKTELLKIFDLTLQSFLTIKKDDNLIKQLKAENEIKPIDYVIKTNYPIEIKPIRAPIGLNHLKTIKNYHIWQKEQGKKNLKKYLVFNLNPIKERKKFEEAVEIAKNENAEIVLY